MAHANLVAPPSLQVDRRYTHWNAGEPNNFEYDNGEKEHCLEMWDRDGAGLAWNDTPCSFETFFICQA